MHPRFRLVRHRGKICSINMQSENGANVTEDLQVDEETKEARSTRIDIAVRGHGRLSPWRIPLTQVTHFVPSSSPRSAREAF